MGWPPKDWRALLALIGSIAGAAVLTGFVWWGVDAIAPGRGWSATTEPHRVETVRWVLWIAAGTIAVVIVGLGFAINRRTFKGSVGKDGVSMEMDGGEDPEVAGSVPPLPKFAVFPPPPPSK